MRTMKRVVYLHGFASSPSSSKARRFHDALTAIGSHVTIPDLAAGDFEHLTITGQLFVLEQAAGDGPVRLIGSSMGGYLAALYAARHPEVERLVLLAPAFGFARRWEATLGKQRIEEWRRTGFLEAYHYGEQRPRRLRWGLIEDGAQYEDYPGFPQPA